jgi:ABC-2 type transport system permease protein/sodium transport system permease protein
MTDRIDQPGLPPSDGRAATPAAVRGGGHGRLRRLCLKELREILRDRRTILTLLLMPLLVYPLLSIAFNRLLLSTASNAGPVQVRVGVSDEADGAIVQRYLKQGDAWLDQGRETPTPETRVPITQRLGGEPSESQIEIEWKQGVDLEQAVASSVLDLAVLIEVRSGEAQQGPVPIRCRLVHRRNSALSEQAYEYFRERFQAVNDRYLKRRLEELQQPLRYPLEMQDQAVGEADAAVSLTTLIPLILILMTITGAVYPAIDLTAGERERGTLETLMAAPVPRMELLAAKYCAVVTVALLTAGANLIAMTITLSSTGLGGLLFGPTGWSWLLVAKVFALLILSAGFYSAVLLALTSFARSFKEAQAYVIPLMLLSLAPGMLSLMPGLEFKGLLAVTPLVNIVLLGRDLFQGSVDPLAALAAVSSTALYAVAAIGLAARIFGTDAILYGSEASWSDLVSGGRRGERRPSISGTMLLLAILFPCSFISVGLLSRLGRDSMAAVLVCGGLATVLLYAVLPVLALKLQRLSPREVFRLRGAHPLVFLAAVVLGICLWPWAHEVYLINQRLGLDALSEDKIEMARGLVAGWREVSPWLILASLTLAPAVCEELLFRGYVLQSLLGPLSARRAIVVSALLFGAFHVLTANVLMVERFLPTAFLGLILGWICWRTGSVFPGMLMHACHNGFLQMVAYYEQTLVRWGWDIPGTHMPPAWLAVSAAGIVIALGLAWRFGESPANGGLD